MASIKHSLEPDKMLKQASDIAEQSYNWVAPRAEKAWKEVRRVTMPTVEAATEKAREGVEHAHEKIVDDILPRLEAAAKGAQEAAKQEGTLSEKASAITTATKRGLMESPKEKKGVAGKVFALFAVLAALGGVGYLLWRRAQPVEDPWAEEYWEDIEAEVVPVDEQA